MKPGKAAAQERGMATPRGGWGLKACPLPHSDPPRMGLIQGNLLAQQVGWVCRAQGGLSAHSLSPGSLLCLVGTMTVQPRRRV